MQRLRARHLVAFRIMHIPQMPSLIPLTLFCLSLLAYSGMVSMQFRHGKLGEQVVLEFLYWYGLAFVGYAGAVLWMECQGNAPRGWLWGGGCLFRLLLLLTVPTLSTDVYRYLWDGHVLLNGVSPYRFPINAAELDGLDIPIRALANHTWMASPYMPVAQWFFAAVAFFFPLKPISLQIASILFDLTTALLLVRLLALARLPQHRLLLYLWNPLVVVEVAHGAHVDAWMVVLMMAAVTAMAYKLQARGTGIALCAVLSPVLLALATLTKLIPILLTPVVWWRWSWRQRLVYAVLTVGLLLPQGLQAGWGLSGTLDGRGLFGALRIYRDRWNFNSGLFHWLERWLMDVGVANYHEWARETVLGVLTALLLWVWLQARRDQHDLRATLRWLAVPLASYILLTTTVHPWYLLILLPFIPLLTPGPDEPPQFWLWASPWLWLSGTLTLSYITYIDPNNLREFEWVRHWEYLPTLCLTLLALVSHTWQRPLMRST